MQLYAKSIKNQNSGSDHCTILYECAYVHLQQLKKLDFYIVHTPLTMYSLHFLSGNNLRIPKDIQS